MLANLTTAQQQLRPLRGDLNATRGEAAQAAAPVNRAPQQIDAADLVTLLSPLGEQISRIRTGLVRVTQAIPPVVQRIAASANRNPALGILEAARTQVLAASAQRAAALAQTVAAALAEARAAQSGETSTGGGQHPEPPATTRPSDAPPRAPAGTATGSGSGLSHPGGTAVSRALDALPVRADNQGPTHGYLLDEHERQIGSDTIRSSRDDTLTEDLDLPRRTALSESMTSHVEAKVAAMMRRGQAPRTPPNCTGIRRCRPNRCGRVRHHRATPHQPDLAPCGARFKTRLKTDKPSGWWSICVAGAETSARCRSSSTTGLWAG